jgi:hypothetical protein
MLESKSDRDMSFKKAAIYKIVVLGELDSASSNRLGLQICTEKKENRKAVTTLIGKIADQAALSGILVRLNDLHMTVLSVKMLDEVDK